MFAAAALATGRIHAGAGFHRASAVHMSVLHLYDPGASAELTAYLEKMRCDLPQSFDEAPKLAHSIAIELDDALNLATLPIPGKPTGYPIIISEADDDNLVEACLSALGCPLGATLTTRDYDALRLVGFCCGDAGSTFCDSSQVTLINGERVAGLRPPPKGMQEVFDATAVLADELDEHFEFTAGASAGQPALVVYGGRAPDGCIVGVLGMV